MNQYIQSKQSEFQKAIDFFKKDIANLRTGRANPALLENVPVEAYGAKTPLNGLASITVTDARSMVVAPWDKNLLKDVEKAIVEAGLGMGVVNEGDKIRVTVPQMTEENRKDLVKKLNEKMETARIALRQVRDEIKADIEEAEKNKEISEDDKFRFIHELDEEVRKLNDELKEVRDKKEGEIMTI
jgi:ribosome recycling factor